MRRVEKYIIFAIAFIGIASFAFWFFKDPVKDYAVNLPGQDNRPDKGSDTSEVVKIGENFTQFETSTSSLTGKWTHFRGNDFDNISKENIQLIDKWGSEGPKILWRVPLGEGHAAPAIYNGKAYLLDYNEAKKADALRCFSLETGKELWRRSYKVHVKRNHGMSRTIPAVNEKYIVTIGPRCQVMCANPQTGDLIWGIDLVKEYKSEVPFWYTGQCPFIDNDIAVIAPGGTSLLIGVDCATGKVVWQTPNPDGWKMSHSSVMPMNFGGKKMYVYAAVGGICGVSAEGNDKGKILWKTKEFAPTVVAPSPLVLDNGKILITAGYGAGAMLFQLVNSGDGFSVKVLQKYRPVQGLASEQQTPNPDGWKMSHSSVMPMSFGGKKMYVYAAVGGICGVSAEGNDKGKILWKTKEFAPTVVAPSPLVLDNGKILITAGYGAGAMLFQLVNSGDGFVVKVLQKYRPIQGLASEQQTPIYMGGYIFSIQPKDAGGTRNQFVCSSANDCMNILWTSGKNDRFGLGPYVVADGKFFILNDDGALAIAKASTSGWTLLDKANVIEGVDSWGPIAIADGYLIMRTSKEMVCIDVRKQ